jgi:hypothetical protein
VVGEAVQYGNALTDRESEKLTYWLNGSFADLEETLNLVAEAINKHPGVSPYDFFKS